MVPKQTITSRNEGRIYALLRFSNRKEKIEITFEEKVRIEGRKKKELVTQVETYYFESEEQENKIRDTKVIISFK